MDSVCPLLGLAGDRRTAIAGVDSGHRCHAEATPIPLEPRIQTQLCLTPGHARCERYVGHMARSGRARPVAVFGDGLVSTRLLVTPEPVWRGIAGRARRAPRGPVIAGAVAIAAIGVGGVAVAAAALGGRLDFAAAEPSAAPAAAASAPSATTTSAPRSPTLEPTPASTQVASATPASEAAESPAQTSTPVPSSQPDPPAATAAPSAPPQQTYAVQQGDTLALIAAQFGTTVQELQGANGIEDPDEIVIGQVLVIP